MEELTKKNKIKLKIGKNYFSEPREVLCVEGNLYLEVGKYYKQVGLYNNGTSITAMIEKQLKGKPRIELHYTSYFENADIWNGEWKSE